MYDRWKLSLQLLIDFSKKAVFLQVFKLKTHTIIQHYRLVMMHENMANPCNIP